ncbi:hypothetical protein E4U16_004377, partial [Claviceps sp. LM84 group G4]
MNSAQHVDVNIQARCVNFTTANLGHVFEIVNGEKTFILERVNQQQGEERVGRRNMHVRSIPM